MDNISDFNRNKTMIVLFISLLVITLAISAIAVTYTLNKTCEGCDCSVQKLPGDNENEEEDQDQDQDQDEQSEENDGETNNGANDSNDTNNNSTNTPSNQGEDEDEEMTSGWNTYYNSKWKFGLKYPKDMVYTESSPNSTLDRIVFVVGGEFTVISIHVADDNVSIDNQVKNILANQCTDDYIMSNLVYPNATFRKGVEVPNSICLDSFGITREQDYSAYAYELDSGAYLVIKNEGDTGLNEEQLEAFLKSVYFN